MKLTEGMISAFNITTTLCRLKKILKLIFMLLGFYVSDQTYFSYIVSSKIIVMAKRNTHYCNEFLKNIVSKG